MEKFSISFKRLPRETGLAAVGHPNQSVDIKVNGKECGWIVAPNWQTEDNKWKVGIKVINGENLNCSWKWIYFKARFETESEARAWVKDNLKRFDEKYKLYFEL
jgi:hypothetical protein